MKNEKNPACSSFILPHSSFMKIGVLALQGAFREHIQMLRHLGVDAVEIRLPEQLADLDGLIIPGGESTTIGKIAAQYGLIEPIREMVAQGKSVWGTCAGMIVLAKDVGIKQPLVGVMDVQVKRNAFGRQVDSFETDLNIPEINNGDVSPFHAIFIRAPLMESVGKDVRVLAKLDDHSIVAARQDNLLATSFHPELTRDPRFHKYFLEITAGGRRRTD
jgi:5'-phosphate synthase pdxT subunit